MLVKTAGAIKNRQSKKCNTTQKTKKISNTDPTKNWGWT